MTSPSSRSSYLGVSPAADALRRIIFGYHSKTKRSISEEAESGDEESVNSWIKDGADPNEKDAYGYTPLINACANGRLKAVQNLVNCSDTNIDFKGPHGILLFLIENGRYL
jgi:ankyrin repeat protein